MKHNKCGQNRIDITGHTFGHLRVLRDSGDRTASGGVYWLCQCTCGNKKKVWGVSLRKGKAQSCGCLQGYTTHGQTAGGKRTGAYVSWSCMIGRCTNTKQRDFDCYGGRGITVCARWQGPLGLIHFLEDMGPRPEGKTLDRKNVEGHYAPENCRWSTPTQQANNRRPRRTADDAVAADAGFGA